jgi:ABC-type (unclassified) transport system, ATPase component
MPSTLEGLELRKWYGTREVVSGVSLDVHQGEIVGLLGPNGAGKTTTFYMLTGIIKPNGGQVLLDGQDIGSWPLHERARVGVSYLPQESSIFRRLTVYQNLQIILEHTGLSVTEQKVRAERLLEDFGLTHLVKSYAMFLSGGERRRLEIARALIREPKFVLLDEPFAGIDPVAVGDIQDLVRRLRDRGIGVLISDHNVRETLTICDRAYLMHQGKRILAGTPDEIIRNEQARNVYLGESFSL